ncbi:HEPN domain-containing protein [Mucilaginibacter psychrotolerans]|uniref:Uncharacterized protein n=1 Tax=Mucilaginibacter psychrotolerans TaxID=1524096 RepID=A0A4Y8SPN9_9SPHI|nr:HEPN domain-containing protein [Mucilaginibacter psychrotolerans]TFF40641.1 hypothetical protein E2R66_00200 [Mucilaginibacter psychrotolerans]
MKIIRTAIPLNGFNIDELTQPFTFNDFDIIKNPVFLQREFGFPILVKYLGLHEFNILVDSICFYAAIGCPDEICENPMLLSIPAFDKIDIFLTCLWFVKDNSCNAPNLFSYVLESGVYSFLNSHSLYTTCIGSHVETKFTDEELNRTVEIVQKLLNIAENDTFNKSIYTDAIVSIPKNGIHLGIMNQVDYNLRNRIERAFLFLKSARSSSFILMKISLYMNIYECLFTTDATEIVHKMAERVACYYTKDKSERLLTFRLIKDAYKIRSRYFHGKELEKKTTFTSTPDLLQRLDNLTRIVLTKIIIEDSSVFLRKDLEPYFEELIFS